MLLSIERPLSALLLASLVALPACGDRAQAQGGPPPAAPVSVAPAVQRAVSETEVFSGRLEAAEFVELRPRVGGTIDKVHFADGARVARGQLLFTVDPRPLEAELARAEAQLAAVRARADLASAEVKRAESLLQQQAVSRQEFDQLASGSRTSVADIRAAEAQVRVARLNRDFTQVRSPIDGRASRAAVTTGNLVSEQTVLTTIAGTSRVYAYFDGSEATFLRLLGDRRAASASASAALAPVVRMGLADEEGYPHQGKVDFVDNRLNPQTGAIRLRAAFDNRDGRFVPGLAVRLTMQGTSSRQAVLVPDRAIGTDQARKVVYVVAADGRPQQREVQTGQVIDGMRVLVGTTVKPGENVVVEGLQRIIPGMPVAPQVLKVDARGMPLPPPPPAPPASAPR